MKAAVPKFRHDTTDILDMHFQIKKAKEVPAPGQYNRFSEFYAK